MSEDLVHNAVAAPMHGEFCWSEIASSDLDSCKAFYANVFGWSFRESENAGSEMTYLEFSSTGGTEPDAALYGMTPEMFGGHLPPAHIAQYVSVDDIDASVSLAVELGGSVVFGPYDIPKVGRMAVVQDPTGAAISMITLANGV